MQKIVVSLLIVVVVAVLADAQQKPVGPPPAQSPRLQISGVYPHLTTYGVYSQNGAHEKSGHSECGIGAIVPWGGKLWMVNYAPHMPKGSEHKLFSIDSSLNMDIHPSSVGGTPAGRLIHRESNQLLIAHYLIDDRGQVRVISPLDMPIRVTAIARHLTDPANLVYYIDMEGSVWEANVHTLDVKMLFKKPVPGWHGKGGYTSQGRLVVSNNGELSVGNYKDLLVGGAAKNNDEAGVLAEFDGREWKIVERLQFTDVTGPGGIYGASDEHATLWAIGWDRRSLRLKVLENGKWHTYLLPKAAWCNDARHGWYTEWPRIREITDGRWMMDMHGMFFDFPKTFSSKNSDGLKPISSHLRYVPDFCQWNGKLVLATDETSIQENKLAGQPQSNLWFGNYEDLKSWGPATGYGGPWIEDQVQAGESSDPYLVAGFDRQVVHLAIGKKSPSSEAKLLRASDQQEIHELPDQLATLPRVSVPRGDWHKPAAGFEFQVDKPVSVYLIVDRRGSPKLEPSWKLTELTLRWGEKQLTDAIYVREFEAGRIEIPGNDTEHIAGSFGLPHMAFIRSSSSDLQINTTLPAQLFQATAPEQLSQKEQSPVKFTIEVDYAGSGEWEKYLDIEVPHNGYVYRILPNDFNAAWIRFTSNQDCIATACLHQTARGRVQGNSSASSTDESHDIFSGLAPAGSASARPALLHPSKRNRNLQLISGDKQFDFTKDSFQFIPEPFDEKLNELLEIEPAFTIDHASVVVKHNGSRLRLPKGSATFDQPFASGWPRAVREVESERNLANIHGTFYEVPLIANGEPPAFHLMRPVASHNKHITDYCSWNGLLVLSGVRADAKSGGHVFADEKLRQSLWFGGIDDLWQLGKPVGVGGPWKNSAIQANEPSDPYLMTGFDKKTLTLAASVDTNFTIEVDVDHQSGWHAYQTIQVKSGEEVKHAFPDGFSAHWIRLRADQECTATAIFVYE